MAKAETVKKEEDELHQKRVLKERQRMQGRTLPSKLEEDFERKLVAVATRGVVELFNTVTDF